ncbi:intraflagellar transport protein 57 homolog isoform X1 [Dermacentor andersoni]|uniref:intraflagellar transport protein 57 homolog isoform X1 n=1 Tax=Dermacentor andersoni TaxID=34620 RepID=UPI002155F9C8|nr:intraflagellar transport protein 57 homolog isoform X1 [Dermacentor andersoni]XP_054927362.1 intraflagellar transport protein 57 homolog isoform X1 [Dermacentor andersoni]
MSSKKREEPAGVDEVGPGQAYLPFVVMEDLLDKLKLINYDTEFTTQFKIKPISRHYFAVPTNPGEQFYIFSSLAAWLIQQAGIEFETPQESDDPNTTISNILDVLRNMGTAIDFPPSRLKQGWGEHVIFVLDHLADKALRKKHFAWKTLLPPEEQLEEEAVVDDAAEVTLEKIEEEMMEEQAADDEDDDDGPVMDLDGLRTLSAGRLGGSSHLNKPEDILQSTVDSAEWKLEVERVLPQLRVTVQPDAKDWRGHLELIHQQRRELDEGLHLTRAQLERLSAGLGSVLDKLASREKYLNAQLEAPLAQYRSVQEALARTREHYRTVSGGITDRSRTLAQITEELEQIKQEMEERGSSMTDGTPLVNIRKALTRLKTEITQMDVRIGVAVHTLLQAKIKEKGNLRDVADAPAASYDSVY